MDSSRLDDKEPVFIWAGSKRRYLRPDAQEMVLIHSAKIEIEIRAGALTELSTDL